MTLSVSLGLAVSEQDPWVLQLLNEDTWLHLAQAGFPLAEEPVWTHTHRLGQVSSPPWVAVPLLNMGGWQRTQRSPRPPPALCCESAQRATPINPCPEFLLMRERCTPVSRGNQAQWVLGRASCVRPGSRMVPFVLRANGYHTAFQVPAHHTQFCHSMESEWASASSGS